MRLPVIGGAWLAIATAAAAGEPMMFSNSAWVCDTPEHYGAAVAEQRAGRDLPALRRELLQAQQCIFVEYDDQDDLLPPFVTLIEERDGLTKVSFMIQSEKRIAFLNRQVAQTRYTGWTDGKRLQTREEWRKLGG